MRSDTLTRWTTTRWAIDEAPELSLSLLPIFEICLVSVSLSLVPLGLMGASALPTSLPPHASLPSPSPSPFPAIPSFASAQPVSSRIANQLAFDNLHIDQYFPPTSIPSIILRPSQQAIAQQFVALNVSLSASRH